MRVNNKHYLNTQLIWTLTLDLHYEPLWAYDIGCESSVFGVIKQMLCCYIVSIRTG